MSEFILREYPQEEYEADMKKLLKEKGLHDAVEHFADRISSLASVMNYVAHRVYGYKHSYCKLTDSCKYFESKSEETDD